MKKYQSVLFFFCALLFAHCSQSPCHEIIGHWSSKEGQTLLFDANGKVCMLMKFGSQVDSFPGTYCYDCSHTPMQLDLQGFSSGPLAGKTLFSILEWNNDHAFRLQSEPGLTPDARPQAFNNDQIQVFEFDGKER